MRRFVSFALPLAVAVSACAAPSLEETDSSGAAASESSRGPIERLSDETQFIRRTESVGGVEVEDFFFERSRLQQVMTALSMSRSTPRGSAACGAPRFSLEFLDGSKKKLASLAVCSELHDTSVLRTGSSTSSFTIDPSLLSTMLQAPTARELTFGLTSVIPSEGPSFSGAAATDFAKGIELSRSAAQVTGCPAGTTSTPSGLPSSFVLERAGRKVGTLLLDCDAEGSAKVLASLKTARKSYAVTVDLTTVNR